MPLHTGYNLSSQEVKIILSEVNSRNYLKQAEYNDQSHLLTLVSLISVIKYFISEQMVLKSFG